MSITEQFQALKDRLRKTVSHARQSAKLDFALDIDRLLVKQNISRSEFAKMIDKSPPYVSKVLRGDANLTINSMVNLVYALGGKLHIKVCAADERAGFITISSAQITAITEAMKRRAASDLLQRGVSVGAWMQHYGTHVGKTQTRPANDELHENVAQAA